MKKTTPQPLRTGSRGPNKGGISHTEVRPLGDGYICQWQYHGSTMTHTKEFPSMTQAMDFIAKVNEDNQ